MTLSRLRDVVIIGAGPAGALTALLLARSGIRATLVDRKTFPRTKVCGGCLNAQAVAALAEAGVVERLRAAGARDTHTIDVHHRLSTTALALPPGLAISRTTMDAELVDAAVGAGCEFLPEMPVLVSPESTSPLRRITWFPRHAQPVAGSARVVVVADGLAHSSLRECPEFRSRVSTDARVGLGAIVDAGTVATAPGVITMAVARAGYVGAVEIEHGHVNVAAAVDASLLKSCGGAVNAVMALLDEASVRYQPSLAAAGFEGTLPLTRSTPRLAGRRVLVIGDAAGYVEPFTGEGMAWAAAAARAVVPFVINGLREWSDTIERDWAATHHRVVGRRQRWCRALTRGLRHPHAAGFALRVLYRWPGLATPFIDHLRSGNQ